MINLDALLADATPETIVHLTYAAGRRANARGLREFDEASDWNKPPREFVGHFVSLRRNARGEQVLTLFVHNRGEAGAFRAFNPKLGTVLSASIG